MEKSKFLIFYYGSNNKNYYIYEINHNNIYSTENYLDAIYVDTKENAIAIASYCNSRETNHTHKVLEIKTTMEIVEE